MSDRLLAVCSDEFERGVKTLFETAPRIPGTEMVETPVIGGRFTPRRQANGTLGPPPGLYERVYRALCSRELFHRNKPFWAIPLPLHKKTIAAMQHANSITLRLVGLYAFSLKKSDWHFDSHPNFHDYCCGLMHYRATPGEIRYNSAMRREFPAKELAGLCDGVLYWRSFQQIARDRENLMRTAVREARGLEITYSE